ncbi:MAG: phosphatidylserine/phosphatidylglycerophosphate/cardiolipin synthase family protein [Candidatus Coproplasma sp.]
MRILRFLFSKLFISLFVIAALCAAIIILCVILHSLLPIAAAICLAYLLSLGATLYLLSGEGAAAFKCAWLAAVVALPVIGAVLCFICHAYSPKGGYGKLMPQAEYDKYEFFNDGGIFLKRLTELISQAKKSVYLEFYIIAKGEIWSNIFVNLRSALERGVEVKIIYDGLGSALRAPKRQFNELKAKGAKIKAFNRLLPMPLSRINIRDHRKIAVIDDRAAFIGGVNIADEYAHITAPHAYWKDGGALFFGRAAGVFSRLFLSLFNGEELPENTPADGEDLPSDSLESNGKEFNGNDLILTPVADMPDRGGGVFEDAIAAAIYGAERRIYIYTPYMCFGEKLCDALSFAARRGVEVIVLIPAVPDKKLPYAITKIYARKLNQSGVIIYEYTPGFMHFKGAVFDDTAFIGSYNFDFRSTRLNYENGAFCSGGLAKDMADDFISCLQLSQPVSFKKQSALGRLWASVLCLFAPLV